MRRFPLDRHDVLLLAGVSCVLLGAWRWSPTLALVMLGVVLASAGLYGAR